MNLLRKFIKASPTDEIASIPMGKFFLARSPQLPKGALECLYNDSVLSMKRTTKPFCYQLSATRAYQEGEASSQSTDGFEDADDDDAADQGARHSDERLFFLCADLHVRLVTRNDGSQIVTWRDVNGDDGETWEFAVDPDIRYSDVDSFMRALYACLYEQKYGRSLAGVQDNALVAEFGADGPPDLEPEPGLDLEPDLGLEPQPDLGLEQASARMSRPVGPVDDARRGPPKQEPVSDDDSYGDASSLPLFIFKDAVAVAGPEVAAFKAQLRIYDATADVFLLVAPSIDIRLVEATPCCLVSTTRRFAFCVRVAQEMNPVFNGDNAAFVFNLYSLDQDGRGASFLVLLQFRSADDFRCFGRHFQDAMSRSLNAKPAGGAADTAYLASMVQNMDLGGSSDDNNDDDNDDNNDNNDDGEAIERRIDKIIRGQVLSKHSRRSGLFVASDSDDDDDPVARNAHNFLALKDPNSGLSLGNANDRSYVTKGDNVGVFKYTDDGMGFVSTIRSLKDADGRKFVPRLSMLHQRDNCLLMTRDAPADCTIYKMDLARGEICESWDVADKGLFEAFAPVSKFAPLTDEQKLLGVSANALFHIDPRLSGSKIASGSSYKSYKTKVAFENLAVTDKGYVAVGLRDGSIRLYSELGKKATVTLPSIGESFEGLDVTKDGRWLLATCLNLLLLIDTQIGAGQKNSGEIGFRKYFDADKKPMPRRLGLRPEHVSLITQATGAPKIQFTRAVFNTSLANDETLIVTSTGPFVVLWSLKDAIKDKAKPALYKIIRHSENVMNKNFSFSSPNDIHAALQNDVVSTNRNALKVANKTSIMEGAGRR
ncbi:VID27-domain-containing protein [Metschnikowia bicuspidata var. bicuspidata NRRL YB-4993]|uniref:VID27-domain-containing protein n=1 Tax=Metschnikowia bicuspidata var. bicuspidata NRRL YB-4993 TaxID=869754 RepID=A0A1A0HBQ7_9ASCO|nr:VID27-domain-containing protein [Metschnikowia bicuspidata var. bicuspidata NRRL YB-4993]OBA21446.1 VID27-domain-containing protein [Metschnikowia bicuspidata var. bicuspidata NRRL YB-4993]